LGYPRDDGVRPDKPQPCSIYQINPLEEAQAIQGANGKDIGRVEERLAIIFHYDEPLKYVLGIILVPEYGYPDIVVMLGDQVLYGDGQVFINDYVYQRLRTQDMFQLILIPIGGSDRQYVVGSSQLDDIAGIIQEIEIDLIELIEIVGES